MVITDKTNKSLFLMIEISQLLKQHQCTYNEAEKIISDLQFELKRQREEKEYETLDDYFAGIKSHICDNEIIECWKHYEVEI